MMVGGKKWTVLPTRLLQHEEIDALRRCAKSRADARRRSKPSRVLECIVLEIALGSGLRVAEIASLACADISLGGQSGAILVRNGKGGKRRTVVVSADLCRKLSEFVRWKKRVGESVDPGAPLLASRQTSGSVSTRALQKMFKRLLKAAGIRSHRFHDLRHTYGSFLLRSSENDLVFVRDQMGHSDLATTSVYLHALNAEKAVNQLYRL